jgi:POT family proton-dependent oligopeptide transporter
LAVELLERFAFYGINYTQTSYLTGAYDEHWNADLTAVQASSYVSVSVAVAYSTPFVGAYLADSLLGDYWSIFTGSLAFYLPGLFLIAFTTVPGLLGREFNRGALTAGLLVLWPFGTGIVKSVVNVFGARQFHPLLQSSQIEAYYVKFYMCINIGALVGGVLVPVLAQRNVTAAYLVPVLMLCGAVATFAAGSPRYVRSLPTGDLFAAGGGGAKQRDSDIPLDVIVRISVLIIPFCIAYSQMATTFIVQGTVMRRAFGFVDAACMNNADAVAVLAIGYWVGHSLYPWLTGRGIKIPTTYKFAIGSALGALAIGWAMVVERMIRGQYERTGDRISILWQAASYILIGAGEIFAVSAAYEVAFTAAPPEKKVLASAINLFCIGGLPSAICIGLYQACEPWFRSSGGSTNITRLHDYSTARVENYFLVLFAISLLGVVVNMLPPVRKYVEDVEEMASDMIKTPKTPVRPPRRERAMMERTEEELGGDEESQFQRIRRHQAYLKYGSGPNLYKSGSFRAGPTMLQKGKSERHVRRNVIKNLYQSSKTEGARPVVHADGKPIHIRNLFRPPSQPHLPGMARGSSQ